MRKPIYIIGGSKGGVGKSLVSMAFLDYLLQKQQAALLIETDTSNPDVWMAYRDQTESQTCDLDEADGWVRFVNICEAKPDKTIVVNTAARNNKGVASYSGTLAGAVAELQRQLVTWWVINRQRDSLELLRDYMTAFPNGMMNVDVIRNGYFGEEGKFELYNDSKLRSELEKRGGHTVMFPDLADRVADDLNSGRLAISTALTDEKKRLPLGNRSELNRWRAEVGKMCGELINAGA
jgi:hypothetical protein